MEEKRINDFISMMTKDDRDASQEFGKVFFKYCSDELGIKKTTIEKEFKEFLKKDGGLLSDYIEIMDCGEFEIPEELETEVANLFKENGPFYDKVYKPKEYSFTICILLFHDMLMKKYIFNDFENYIKRISNKKYNEEYTEYIYNKENIIMFYVKELLYMNMSNHVPKKYIDILSKYAISHSDVILRKTKEEEIQTQLCSFQNIGNSFDDNSALLYYSFCTLFSIDEFKEDLIEIILAMYKREHPDIYRFITEQEEIDFADLNMYLLSMQGYHFGVESAFAIKTIALYAVLADKKMQNLEKYINIDAHYKYDIFLSELLSPARFHSNYLKAAGEYYDKEIEKFYNKSHITELFLSFESIYNHDSHHFYMDHNYAKHFFLQVLSSCGLFYYNQPYVLTTDASKMVYNLLFNEEKEKTIEDYKRINNLLLKTILGLSLHATSLKVEKTNTIFDRYMENLDFSNTQVDYDELKAKQDETIKKNSDNIRKEEKQKYDAMLTEKDNKIQELALIIERLTNENEKLKDFIENEKEQNHIQETDINKEIEQIEEENVSFEDMVSFLNKYRIKYIGGHISVHNRLKNLCPNWDFYEGGNGFHWNENEVFKSTDYCVLHFTKIGHGESGKIKRAIENYQIPMIYVSNNNIERIIANIYQDIQEYLLEQEENNIEK